MRIVPWIVISALATAGCAHGRDFRVASNRKTCVVLSVGGADGLAHLGALQAIGESELDVDCVTGTSMGSLIGGLYASAPDSSTSDRYREFMASYVAMTKSEASDRGLFGALLLGGLALVTGGGALLIAGAAAAGGLAGAGSVDKVQLERTTAAYDKYVGSVEIQDLPVPYATFYLELAGGSLRIAPVERGPLAEGVKRSIANPMIFDEIDPKSAGYLDPGVDRIAAVPIKDTCELFPRHQILAINVTEQPADYDGADCPVLEVRVDADAPTKGSALEQLMMGRGPEFDRVVAAGYGATLSALEG